MHQPGEVIFEFTRNGAFVRVTAVDVATGTEVSVVCPVNVPQSHAQQVAAQKLRRKLAGGKAGNPGIPTPLDGSLTV